MLLMTLGKVLKMIVIMPDIVVRSLMIWLGSCIKLFWARANAEGSFCKMAFCPDMERLPNSGSLPQHLSAVTPAQPLSCS
ncbi:hypothetical protein A6R68_09743 [Neotoma lepida]|uniref:Uncharacterized protein n=1 Tax=Neotoma lepida TaxID=56216 RepID=A0A1A6G157_NEOLE|nr:hypothetical protein A6R68_09743 [Neotoma lepida]